MPYRYSLFVNGQALGPYERRMIVGMRVKKIVSNEQIVLRDDGVEMRVAQLLQSREDAPSSQSLQHYPSEISTSNFSVGMWPEFSVRFGGGPVKPGALGFNGLGQISYLGSELLFKGNRRNSNLGMSRHEDRVLLSEIQSARADRCFAELKLKPEQEHNAARDVLLLRIECMTDHEAQELCGLINVPVSQFLPDLGFAASQVS